MWRAAFPGAKSVDEKIEFNWVKSNFDIKAGTSRELMRLAGVWIPLDVAEWLAPSYNMPSQTSSLLTVLVTQCPF
jgi:hypothetical protein